MATNEQIKQIKTQLLDAGYQTFGTETRPVKELAGPRKPEPIFKPKEPVGPLAPKDQVRTRQALDIHVEPAATVDPDTENFAALKVFKAAGITFADSRMFDNRHTFLDVKFPEAPAAAKPAGKKPANPQS